MAEVIDRWTSLLVWWFTHAEPVAYSFLTLQRKTHARRLFVAISES